MYVSACLTSSDSPSAASTPSLAVGPSGLATGTLEISKRLIRTETPTRRVSRCVC